MRRSARLLIALAAACGDNSEGDDRQGGDTTVDDRSPGAYRHPAANLTANELERFQRGRSPFDFKWEVPKLGPLFNNDACLGCHTGNGRGTTTIDMGPLSQALVRVSLTEGMPEVPGGAVPVPGLGTQLQDHATVGLPEVRITLRWVESSVMYGDGDVEMMREPRVDVVTANGESLPPNTRFSFRIAPTLIGLGLLEAIPESSLLAHADPDDADGDGISGRANQVWDPAMRQTVLGRFGWKSNTSTLHIQVAAAFVNDMGLTSYVFPEGDGMRDVADPQLDDTRFFTSTIAVPAAGARSGEAWRGRGLFRDFGCASCHVPAFETGDHPLDAVAHQRIFPYTDLLLHDMGDRLTDARPDFLATGVEWRTPPLWGIGVAKRVLQAATFLHDGRARTVAEAILWHGGEADAAREAFRTASRADRAALLAFLDSL